MQFGLWKHGSLIQGSQKAGSILKKTCLESGISHPPVMAAVCYDGDPALCLSRAGLMHVLGLIFALLKHWRLPDFGAQR